MTNSTIEQVTETSSVVWDPDLLTRSDLRGRVVYRPEFARAARVDQPRIPLPLPQGDVALGELVLDLTARHPYTDIGWMDFYQPARWDCTSDTIFMDTIKVNPPGSLGPNWEGTVGYANFTALTDNLYVVVVNFSGHSATASMDLNGPWGKRTKFLPPMGYDSAGHLQAATGAVTAVWDGAAGDKFGCSFLSHIGSSSNIIIPGGTIDLAIPLVYFKSFQVYTAA
jgi:hypothetical protein